MPGRVGFVSRSGTLVYQIVHELTQRGIGQSTCVGMGGDPVHGIGFIEALAMFEADPETDLMIMTGEIGGDDEERAADYIAEHVTKPVVAYIAGFEAPPGQAHGPRRRDRDRVEGHGGREGRGARGRRGAGREDAQPGGRAGPGGSGMTLVGGRRPTGGLVHPRPPRRRADRASSARQPPPCAVAALGQVPPSLVNVAGGGLAVPTQLRVGWLYTMAGHAVAITATGSGGAVEGLGAGVVGVRLGMLTIAAVAVAMLVFGARATARRVDDVGVRRVVAGASIAVPYAVLIGGVNAGVRPAAADGRAGSCRRRPRSRLPCGRGSCSRARSRSSWARSAGGRRRHLARARPGPRGAGGPAGLRLGDGTVLRRPARASPRCGRRVSSATRSRCGRGVRSGRGSTSDTRRC